MGDVMGDFEQRKSDDSPKQDNPSEQIDKSASDLNRLTVPSSFVARTAKIENLLEGELADILQVQIGACDPDILDHLTSIEVEGIGTGALVPIHPETGRRIATIGEAYTIGQERDRFVDGYAYAEFQERLGRTTLFHLACVKSGAPRLSLERAMNIEGLLDLDAVGKVSYGRAALEGFELRDERTGIWQTIYENFEICRLALTLLHKHVVFNLGN